MHNKLEANVQKVISRQVEQINQNVFVRNLVLRTQDMGSYGESEDVHSSNTEPTTTRLTKFIKFLFDFVNEDHRANYYDKISETEYLLNQKKKIMLLDCS